MSVTFPRLPARYEGPHICVGQIVKEEAQRMIALAPYLGGGKDLPPESVRLAGIEEGIWAWLRVGVCRVLSPAEQEERGLESPLVYWHEPDQEFVPWSAALNRYFLERAVRSFERTQDRIYRHVHPVFDPRNREN